jgi:hypothetical protein
LIGSGRVNANAVMLSPVSIGHSVQPEIKCNRPEFYMDITLLFYGYNRPGAKISEGIRFAYRENGLRMVSPSNRLEPVAA